MNTIYTITINRRKYVTTDCDEARSFADYWENKNWIYVQDTTETIPNVIAV